MNWKLMLACAFGFVLLSGCSESTAQAAPTPTSAPRPDVPLIDERYALEGRNVAGPNLVDGDYRTFTFDAKDERRFVTTTMTWYHVDGSPATLGHSQGACQAVDPLDAMASDYRTVYTAPNGSQYVENQLAGPNSAAGYVKHQRSFPWAAGTWSAAVEWCGYNTDVELVIVASDTKTPTHKHGVWGRAQA